MTSKRILTESEAVEFLGGIIKRRTLQDWRRIFNNTGVLKGPRFLKIESKVGYAVDDLEAYLEASTVRPKESA